MNSSVLNLADFLSIKVNLICINMEKTDVCGIKLYPPTPTALIRCVWIRLTNPWLVHKT